ncbi:MAG: hypothetical protein CVV41_02195 [Candidatus Riflebacteria bacterium HGW-Riflebacteria-1]|jgi:hypothetical protein|nr:MAG: hypothetical protein CVV41_02195 [Candidatus Riflebacteria bacterium HGW-Riflebacteria-1]
MEPADFAVRIEEVMAEECSKYECVLVDDDEIGILWTFVIEDTFSGFLSVEDNEETLKVRTVTLGMHLKDITDISREELLELFASNASLVSANFSVVKFPVAQDEAAPVIIDEGEDLEIDEDDEQPEMRDMLIIQTRLPFEAFSPDDFGGFVQNLLFQAEMYLTQSEDDDEDGAIGDFDDDESDDDDFDD